MCLTRAALRHARSFYGILRSMRHGFLLINKPEGPTSHDIVAMVRKRFGERKVGHLGTLDPAAEGLLVLAVGAKALKVVELYTELDKQYVAGVTFGSVSSTYDREGVIEVFDRKPGVHEPDELAVRIAIDDQFVGRIEQIPPDASAIKIGGERAYRKMRQGKHVDMPARDVVIKSCSILSYAYPYVELKVSCSSGTYIRSLAHDLGKTLRIGGYLSSLRRTNVGEWNIEDAVSPDSAAWGNVLPLKDILADCPRIELEDGEAQHIQHGRDILATVERNTIGWHNGLPIAILEPHGEGAHARKVL